MKNVGVILVGAIVASILCVMFSSDAKADMSDWCSEGWGVSTVASYHIDRDTKHNESNWGLGFECQVMEKGSLVGGVYENSYWRQSKYLGVTYLPYKLGPAKIGAMFGAVTGYDRTVTPVIIPTIAFEGTRYGMNIGIIPSIDDGLAMIGLQLKMKFW